MLKIPFLACLLAASALFATPVQDHGALRVADGVIVDKNGNPPQLRGMSLFWNRYSEGSPYYNANTVSTLAKSWNASIVRAAIGNTSAQDAKTIIDAAINEGIYVLADWHRHGIELEAAKTFFSDVSSHVKSKGNPDNVIYEIFNEPVDLTWAQIKAYAEQIIPVIRANSPNNLIVVGTPNYSANITSPSTDFINAANIAYAFHFYASEPGHESLKNSVNRAVCAKVPVFITEWGLSPASGQCKSDNLDEKNYEIDNNMVKGWVSFMETHKLSWVNWSISNKKECSSTTLEATSTSGKYIKDLIVKLNGGQSHADVGPVEIPPCDQSQQGPVVIGSRDTLQAENYSNHAGLGSKQSDNLASEKAYLGTLGAGSKTVYALRAPKDTVVVLNIRYRIPGATATSTNVKATIKISDGVHEYTYGLQERNGWASRASIAPVQLSPSTDVTIEVVSGSVDIDYYTWRAVQASDYNDENWPDLANWGSSNQTPIAKNVRLQTENAAKAYYNLKGNPLGNTLPKEQGVYILKQGGVSKMVLVK